MTDWTLTFNVYSSFLIGYFWCVFGKTNFWKITCLLRNWPLWVKSEFTNIKCESNVMEGLTNEVPNQNSVVTIIFTIIGHNITIFPSWKNLSTFSIVTLYRQQLAKEYQLVRHCWLTERQLFEEWKWPVHLIEKYPQDQLLNSKIKFHLVLATFHSTFRGDNCVVLCCVVLCCVVNSILNLYFQSQVAAFIKNHGNQRRTIQMHLYT
jgi:hypothetical protein